MEEDSRPKNLEGRGCVQLDRPREMDEGSNFEFPNNDETYTHNPNVKMTNFEFPKAFVEPSRSYWLKKDFAR